MNRIEVFEGEQTNLLVSGLMDFSLEATLECGQCFRWRRNADGSYTGVVKGRALTLHQLEPDKLLLENTTEVEFDEIWAPYFDLSKDYGEIQRTLSEGDVRLRDAIAFAGGLRLLNQEPWEMLISYIISANNNIPKIKKSIERLSVEYGTAIDHRGERLYGFPTAEQLAEIGVDELKECHVGYRCKYIHDAVRMYSSGEISFQEIKKSDYRSGKKLLQRIPGVGPKVADCILLFSLEKYEAYPVDVWIKKVTEKLYFQREASRKEIEDFAREAFGVYAGYAQEYLFYYIRKNNLE